MRAYFLLIVFLLASACTRYVVEPKTISVIPEERIPVDVYRERFGRRTLLDPATLTFETAGMSSLVNDEGNIIVFAQADVGSTGVIHIRRNNREIAQVPVALVDLTASDAATIDATLSDIEAKNSAYLASAGALKTARDALVAEHEAPATDMFIPESFVFQLNYAAWKAGNETPALFEVRRPVGSAGAYEVIPTEQAFFKLTDWHFKSKPVNYELNSSGNPIPCGDPNGCWVTEVTAAVTLNSMEAPAVVDKVARIHTNVAGQTNGVLGYSYRANASATETQVVYMLHPVEWCGILYDSFGPIQQTSTTCATLLGPPTVTTTGGNGEQNVSWTLHAIATSPAPDWSMKNLALVGLRVSTSRFADLEQAEQVAMAMFRSALEQQAALVKRKLQALNELQQLGLSGTSVPANIDYVRGFWTKQLERLQDAGAKKAFDESVEKLQEMTGKPLEEISESLFETWETANKMKAFANMIDVIAQADTPMSPTDRIRKVKEVFDLARDLAPGGPMATAIAPFLDFYSTAMGAVADALDRINELRMKQVISTGACEQITPALVADPQVQAQWMKACKLRNLLQKIRDP